MTSVHYLFLHQSNSLLKTGKEIKASIAKVSCLDVNSKYWSLKLGPSHNTFFYFLSDGTFTYAIFIQVLICLSNKNLCCL